MKSKRIIVMMWWNNLPSLEKKDICNSNSKLLIGGPRNWESLTGREIEVIYDNIFNFYKEDSSIKNRGTQKSPFGMWS